MYGENTKIDLYKDGNTILKWYFYNMDHMLNFETPFYCGILNPEQVSDVSASYHPQSVCNLWI